MKKGFWFCVKIGTVFLLILATVEFVAAPFLIQLFRKGDAQVLESVSKRCGSSALHTASTAGS